MMEVTIKLIAGQEEIEDFLRLCSKIQIISETGCSTTIPVHVDADGSGKLKFEVFLENEETNLIDTIATHIRGSFLKEIETKPKTHWIGE